jgi:hypothetical protein
LRNTSKVSNRLVSDSVISMDVAACTGIRNLEGL